MYPLVMGCSDSRKRVFLLGPSHHIHLPNAALSQCTTYETPLGDLTIDTDSKLFSYPGLKVVIKELKSKGNFTTMSISADEDEHSLEMHLPYIYTILSKSPQFMKHF
jgi:AmmeMemoRadiSam system protein B